MEVPKKLVYGLSTPGPIGLPHAWIIASPDYTRSPGRVARGGEAAWPVRSEARQNSRTMLSHIALWDRLQWYFSTSLSPDSEVLTLSSVPLLRVAKYRFLSDPG